jgi:hypothetical protein
VSGELTQRQHDPAIAYMIFNLTSKFLIEKVRIYVKQVKILISADHSLKFTHFAIIILAEFA